jgi:hypothetical protein
LINIAHIGKIGVVLTGLFIYKESKPIKIIRKRYRLNEFNASIEKPLIIIKGKKYLKDISRTIMNILPKFIEKKMILYWI